MPGVPPQLVHRAFRLVRTLALVVLVTFLNFKIIGANPATAALSYLIIILGLATWTGLEESLLASLASVLCYNFFFLPPIGTLVIKDPQNWVALFVFLVTAVTASRLSTNARRRAEEANARRSEMERLYEFSRALILGDNDCKLSSQIARQAAVAFDVPVVAFYDVGSDSVMRSGRDEAPSSAEMSTRMREVSLTGEAWHDTDTRTRIIPVALGGQSLGSLYVSGVVLSDAVLSAISQLAAIALERARVQHLLNRAEAMNEGEQLKSTLLDALAHEFKTPLTSIKAAVSTVLSQRAQDQVADELLTIIDEEADRLTRLVTETIQMARIEAGELHLHLQPYSVSTLILSALSDLRILCEGRDIQVRLSQDLPDVQVDPELVGLVLRQLISNALKYAPPSASIRIATERQDACITIHVANDGPGIPGSEQEAIFEKFYRGQSVRQRIPGTGMGLTIARAIIQSHKGKIWVESKPEEGVRFSFTLPSEIGNDEKRTEIVYDYRQDPRHR